MPAASTCGVGDDQALIAAESASAQQITAALLAVHGSLGAVSAATSIADTFRTITARTRLDKETTGIFHNHHCVDPTATRGVWPVTWMVPSTITAAVMCHRYTDMATPFAAITRRHARGEPSSHRLMRGASAAAVSEYAMPNRTKANEGGWVGLCSRPP